MTINILSCAGNRRQELLGTNFSENINQAEAIFGCLLTGQGVGSGSSGTFLLDTFSWPRVYTTMARK